MRIPFLRPKAEAAAAASKPKRSRAAKAVPVVDDVLDVQTARTQARRRLIGAVVLLAVGVIGFPVLFETQPRPLPLDTPMDAVRREAAATGVVSRESTPARPAPLTMPPADAGNEVAASASPPAGPSPAGLPATATATATAASASAAAAVQAAARPVASAAAAGVVKVASAAGVITESANPAPAAKPVASTPAARPAPAPVPAKAVPEAAPADAAPPRFIVQAGAYKESGKLREARGKIEALGFKTYTQIVENDGGSRTRVRVGPFSTHDEAEAVAARIKKSGLPAAIVKL